MKPRLSAWWMSLALTGCGSIAGFGDYNQQTVGSLHRVEIPPVQPRAAEKNRATAIHHYEAFLEESPDSRFVPEALRRLADLNLAVEQQALAEGQPPPDGSRAAELYAELLRRFPEAQHNDTALYQLARAREQSGDLQPAMEALTRFTAQYRDSDRYDEAQFRRGEYLFVQRDYGAAEQAYQAVIAQGTGSAYHQQALYKSGWARFKQNHYRAALDAFIRLLDETIADVDGGELPASLSRSDRERIDDTLRAISLSFSYLGDTTQISDYFSTKGTRAYEPLVYARLAALHLGKERFSDAAAVYRLFSETHPQHREAPLFLSRVIDVYKQAGFGDKVLQEKQAFIERYQPAATYWRQHDADASPQVMAQVQRHLRDVARHYHALAQANHEARTYAQAGRWYRLFLQAFPRSDQTPLMNFLYAELLTSAGQQGEAARQYEQTAYAYGRHDKAAEAGYAALLAYAKHEAQLTGAQKASWHLAGIHSALRFSEQFSTHPQAMAVRTRAAQQLYAGGDFAAAITAARPVIDNPQAGAKLQLSAWTVTAHAEFDQGDYQRAELAYGEVLARTARAAPQRDKLADKLAACIYKQGEAEKAAGNLDGAAEHFLRIAQAAPGSSLIATAQYDAAAAYIALQRWPAAIGILEKWRGDYPRHPLQQDATRKLAALYRENNQPVRAAAEFERLAETESDPALKREAALTTATLYRDAGRDRQAIEAYARFVQRYPRPVEAAMEAGHQLVRLYGAAGQTDQQRHWRQKLIAADRGAGGERSARTRFLAAHAQLALTEPQGQGYRQIALKEPLKRNLARKKKLLQAAIEGYKAAAAYEVTEVTTEATFRIGELYRDFAGALLSSERPRGLNTEELEQYNLLLEDQAYPFEEKAIAVHENNAQRIAAGIYDPWIRKSMQALARLLPVRYAKPEEGERFVAVLE